MYAGDEALKIYADFVGIPFDDARRIREEFDPREMLLPDRVQGLAELLPDAIKFKFISQPLTDAQLKELVQIPQ
jgi:NitT/TauT family transport system substrate-binding protein